MPCLHSHLVVFRLLVSATRRSNISIHGSDRGLSYSTTSVFSLRLKMAGPGDSRTGYFLRKRPLQRFPKKCGYDKQAVTVYKTHFIYLFRLNLCIYQENNANCDNIKFRGREDLKYVPDFHILDFGCKYNSHQCVAEQMRNVTCQCENLRF